MTKSRIPIASHLLAAKPEHPEGAQGTRGLMIRMTVPMAFRIGKTATRANHGAPQTLTQMRTGSNTFTMA